MKSKIVLAFIFFAVLRSFAESPQSINLFPHQVGDMWEYIVSDWETHVPLDTYQVKIVKDSVDAEGNTYIFRVGRTVHPPSTWWSPMPQKPEFVIDTLNQVWGSYSGGVNVDSTILYKLGGKKGDQWVIWDYGNNTSFDMGRIDDIYQDYIFNMNKFFMGIRYYYAFEGIDSTGLGYYGDLLAEDLGLVYRSGGLELGDITLLRGAVINGVLYGDTSEVTSIKKNEDFKPIEIILYQNYPNPFNSSTTISFDLPEEANIALEVYDLTGRRIRCLTNGYYQAGNHQVVWDGTNDRGNPVASGIYIYRLVAGDYVQSRKMMLMK